MIGRVDEILSGRLMRTLYYPKWQKLFSESKGSDVWYPQEIRIYDEVEKANSTVILIKSVDLRSLVVALVLSRSHSIPVWLTGAPGMVYCLMGFCRLVGDTAMRRARAQEAQGG